jgi:hypothetical protein
VGLGGPGEAWLGLVGIGGARSQGSDHVVLIVAI